MQTAKLVVGARRLTESHRNYVVAGVIVVLILLLGYVLPNVPGTKVDWLNQSDWSNFNGATRTADGLKITPTGRVINHRDTSTAQPNPPVNARGSYLNVAGDFTISAQVAELQDQPTLQFYGQVPVIYDEWRQERPSIRLEASHDQLRVRIWDGSAATSMDEQTFTIERSDKVTFDLIHTDDQFIFRANGKSLGAMPDHNIFASGTVWLGADAGLDGDGWTLLRLTAKGMNNGTVELVTPDLPKAAIEPTSLRALAQKHPKKLAIGAAVSIGPLLTDGKYSEIALGQFSMITPENSFKPQFIHPLKDLYLFKDTDTLVEIAAKNRMLVHGHSLVMGKANPEWMQDTPDTERRAVMTEHVSTIVGHYKGKIAQWDVVNEPLSEDDIDYKSTQDGLRSQMWFDVMGEQYIDIAFKAARAADPKVKLYLNDFGLENDGKRWDAFLRLVKRLQARGVPLDGVGFEAHVYHTPADTIDTAALKRHIQILAGLGIESRISEIDVLGDDTAFQAKQYADVLRVCLEEPSCKSYGVWGITDLYGSTTLSDRYPIMLGDSLVWQPDYTPRPALKSLQSVLSGK